jgi:hypothetical protein
VLPFSGRAKVSLRIVELQILGMLSQILGLVLNSDRSGTVFDDSKLKRKGGRFAGAKAHK